MITIICAMGRNGAIGKGNALLWRLPGDLKRFKAVTMGHPIIMGRKTYESIGRPLPGRTNIILSKNASFAAEGCTVIRTMENALTVAKAAEGGNEIFIVGGAQIYAMTIGLVDRMLLTMVEDAPVDADVFFPAYSGFAVREESAPVVENGIQYRVVELVRVG